MSEPRRQAKRLRCAIYTRKSSEEGLEQAFNSLDAQREACAAFIVSQKHEGWTVSDRCASSRPNWKKQGSGANGGY
jgi:DNA invertase Pin-like site-specific DNA recombinase